MSTRPIRFVDDAADTKKRSVFTTNLGNIWILHIVRHTSSCREWWMAKSLDVQKFQVYRLQKKKNWLINLYLVDDDRNIVWQLLDLISVTDTSSHHRRNRRGRAGCGFCTFVKQHTNWLLCAHFVPVWNDDVHMHMHRKLRVQHHRVQQTIYASSPRYAIHSNLRQPTAEIPRKQFNREQTKCAMLYFWVMWAVLAYRKIVCVDF